MNKISKFLWTSLLGTTLLGSTVVGVPETQAFFWYSPDAKEITRDIGVEGPERKVINEIISDNYDYMEGKGEFASYKDDEMTLLAYVADALDVHTFPKDYFTEKDNLLPETTKRLIDTANREDVSYQSLAEIISFHDKFDLEGDDYARRIEDLASSVESFMDNPEKKMMLSLSFQKAIGPQESYLAFTRPAVILADEFPSVPADTMGSRISFLAGISDAEAYNDPEKLLEALRHSEGTLNANPSESSLYNGILDILVENVDIGESPVTYTRLANDLFNRYSSFQKSEDINWTLEQMRSDLQVAHALLEERGQVITPEKQVNIAIGMPLDNYVEGVWKDQKFKNMLKKSPEIEPFYNAIMSIPFIHKNLEALKFKGRYRPLNEANFWNESLDKTADVNDIKVTDNLESRCITVFKALSKLPLTGGFKDFNPDIPKRKQLSALERVQGYTYELINNAVDYTSAIDMSGYPFEWSLSFLDDFADTSETKDKLAFYVKNANSILLTGSENGYTAKEIEKLASIFKQNALDIEGYFGPEKYAAAFTHVLETVEPDQVFAYGKVMGKLLELTEQEGFFDSHGEVVPDSFARPGAKIMGYKKETGMSLDETLLRMEDVMNSWERTKQDMKDRPHVYKGQPELGVLQPEKLANDIMKKPERDFYQSNDPILNVFKQFEPDANQFYKDNPNILEKSIQQYRAGTPHLSEKERIAILEGVDSLILSEEPFDSVDLLAIDRSAEAYFNGLDEAGIYAEKLFRAASELGNMDALREGKVSYDDALDLLEFFNEKCNDIRDDSRLLYVRKTAEIIDGAVSHGIGLDVVKEMTAQAVRIPDQPKNQARYQPPDTYNFRSMTKVANALDTLFDEAEDLTPEKFYQIVTISKHLSYLVAPQEDMNALFANAHKLHNTLDELYEGDILPGELVAEGINQMYASSDPMHNWEKPGKVVMDAQQLIHRKMSNQYGILPR
ncbi:MAG: hypothetical protein ACLFP2_03350 [Candidatus Woesearchaeota archaeon]